MTAVVLHRPRLGLGRLFARILHRRPALLRPASGPGAEQAPELAPRASAVAALLPPERHAGLRALPAPPRPWRPAPADLAARAHDALRALAAPRGGDNAVARQMARALATAKAEGAQDLTRALERQVDYARARRAQAEQALRVLDAVLSWPARLGLDPEDPDGDGVAGDWLALRRIHERAKGGA